MNVNRVYKAKNWDELMTIIYGYELKRIVWAQLSKDQITVGVR